MSRPRLAALGFHLLLILPLTAAQGPIASYPPLPAEVSPITVIDSQGRYVGRILPQQRYWVPLERIPTLLQRALLAVEDARFYDHGGIDLRGIARALVTDVAKGRMVQGGSTITQQLMKNKYLSSEVSMDRKLKEARLAMDFETRYSKQQILEMYFNEIYYGNGATGLVQAARLYFNKRPEELSESECILFAGLPKNPSRYNPLGKPTDLAERRAVVVKRLVELNWISAQQGQSLQAQTVTLPPRSQAPHYLAQIRSQLVARFGPDIIERGGLEVTAPMDLDLQHAAEQALREGVARIAPNLQGALVCLDPATGDVLAAVGGVETGPVGLNRAFTSRRQPGSAIKPLIYAAAVDKGLTASSLWSDEPVSYDRGHGQTWTPHNYGHEAFGQLPLRQALAHSGNVITVKVLNQIGVPALVDLGARCGLPLRASSGLSLALGTDDVTLKDLVQAYTPLANGGLRAEPRTMVRIWDRRQRSWIEFPPALSPALGPGPAFITTQMMKDVLRYGTAKSLRGFSLAHPAAGKTGTTDANQDAWFIGFTPSLVTGVWVGYDQPRSGGASFTGGRVAAPIWERFMLKATAARPVVDFPQPEGVLARIIDPATGLLASDACPKPQTEYYLTGSEPALPCPEHPGTPLPQPEPPPVVAHKPPENAAPAVP